MDFYYRSSHAKNKNICVGGEGSVVGQKDGFSERKRCTLKGTTRGKGKRS